MATAKIINNILKDEAIDVEIIDCKTVEDVVRKYAKDDSYSQSFIECYDPDTDKTTFIPLDDNDTDTLSVSVIVNNEDTTLDYEIKENDIVTVIILPAGGKSDRFWAGVKGHLAGSLVGGLIGATAGFIFGGPWGAAIGVGVGAFIGGFAGQGLSLYMYDKMRDRSKTSKTSLEGESTLGVRGSSNQSIVSNNYPLVLGKHLTTPMIVGSPWSVATGEYGIDQEIRVLYAVGYGPLKLTNFKLDSVLLAHNEPWKNNTELKTIMKGKLSGVSDDDKGEITNRFYNNDIEVEILQQNPDDEVDYGTIFSEATIETEINATPLFIADKDLSDVAQTKYKGSRFPRYFRNNSVRFSQSCPKKITLELQASSGLYSTWSYSGKSESYSKYASIPIWYAIQYRVYSDENASSNAESGEGWTSFTSFNADTNHPVYAQIFTEELRTADIEAHSGNSFDDDKKAELNASWVGELLFNFQDAYDASDDQNNVSDMRFTGSVQFTLAECKSILAATNPSKLVEVRVIRVSPAYFDETSTSDEKNGPKSFQDLITWNTLTTVKFDEDVISQATAGTNEKTYQVLKESYNRKVKNNQWTSWTKTNSQWITISEDEYETYKADLDVKHESNYTEWKWVYYVTCKESETVYEKGYLDYYVYSKLRIVENNIGDEVPSLTPISEDKMRKLCLVAIKAKADSGGNIKGQLKKFTVIAEAFQPYVDLTTKKLFPENITKTVDYYYPKYYDETLKVWNKGEKIEATDEQTAKEIYENLRLQGIKATAIKRGNDLVSQLQACIFNDSFKDSSGRYFLNTDTTSNIRKCNETNAVSSALYWLLGPHAGADALDYSDIDLISVVEAFEDCNEVIDGSTYSKQTTDADGTVHNVGDEVKIKYSANGWIYKATKAETVLANILAAGRCTYTRSEDNKIQFIFDKAEDFPTMIVNQQNCISHSISYSYADTPSGLIMEFPDENDEYDTNTIYCMEDAEDSENPEKALESYSLQYATNSYQVWSLGRYVLANRVLDKKVVYAKVGWEGFNASLGGTVVVQLPTLLLGTDLGGRIKHLIEDDDYIYGFICDELYNFTGETEVIDTVTKSSQGVEIFQPTKKSKSNCITLRLALPDTEISVIEKDDEGYVETVVYKNEIGYTNIVIFDKKISKADESLYGETSDILYYKPQPDNIVNFGYIGSISETFKITKIKADKDFNYDLTMCNYSPEIYKYGKALPAFQNHMTIPDRSGESYNLSNDLTADVLTEKLSNVVDIEAITNNVSANITSGSTASAPAAPTGVVAYAYKDNLLLQCDAPVIKDESNKLSQTISKYIWSLRRKGESSFTEIAKTNTNNYNYAFNRTKDGYPEAVDFSDWEISVSCVSIYGLSSDSTKGVVNTDSYGTWKVNAPTNIKMVAQEDGLVCSWDYSENTKFYGQVVFVPTLKCGTVRRTTNNTSLKTFTYKFDRTLDKYPEKKTVYENLTSDEKSFYSKTTSLGEYSLTITATDVFSGNTAVNSGIDIEDSEYKSWLPSSFEGVASAYKDLLKISWDKQSEIYGLSFYKIQLSKNGTSDTFNRITANEYNYYFNRMTDGYPEYEDFSNWNIIITHYNKVYESAFTEVLTTFINTDSYGTWKPSAPWNLKLKASENKLSYTWDYTAPVREFYGNLSFKAYLLYDSEQRNVLTTKELYAEYTFNRDIDLYPEKNDIFTNLDTDIYSKSTNLSLYSIKIEAIDNVSKNSASKTLDSTVNDSEYKTWIPDTVSLTVIADKNTLNTNWTIPTCYGVNKFNVIITNKNHSEKKTGISNYFYNYVYNREIDGFPEASDFLGWAVTLEHITDVYTVPTITTLKSIDTTSYGTWLTTEPIVTSRVNDRTISLSVSQNEFKLGRELYGDIYYRIQVKRLDTDNVFYEPNLTSNPYPESKTVAVVKSINLTDSKIASIVIDGRYNLEDNCSVVVNSKTYALSNEAGLTSELILTTEITSSLVSVGDTVVVINSEQNVLNSEYTNETAYKGEENGYQQITETFIQTMPLAGQSINEPSLRDTAYYFRVTTYNVSTQTESSPTFVAVTALCTNIQDVVNANADYKELYVKELSAIAANLGIIKQGAFGSENQNHIAMSTVTDENGNIWYKGDVRLGGDNEYLEIKPVVENGEIIDYKITLKAGNINLTTSGSKIAEGTFIYDESDNSKRMRLSAAGLDIEQAHYTNNEIDYWETKALINTDQNGNMYIVNGDPKQISDCPIIGTEISGGSIYHFDKNTLDQNGANEGDITCDGEIIDEPGVVSNDCFSGSIIKNLSSVTKDITMFRQKYISIGSALIEKSGNISTDPDFYNENVGSSWGLPAAQVKAKIFKIRY